jgi:hypothetical protein
MPSLNPRASRKQPEEKAKAVACLNFSVDAKADAPTLGTTHGRTVQDDLPQVVGRVQPGESAIHTGQGTLTSATTVRVLRSSSVTQH